jgi:hypothetical protein
MKRGDIVQFETIPFEGITAGIKIFTMIPKLKAGLTWHPTHSAHLEDEATVNSAELEGMKYVPLSYWQNKNFRYKIYRLKFGEENFDYAMNELNKNINSGYNFLQYASFMFKRFWCEVANLILPDKWQINIMALKNWFPNGDVCSERLRRYLICRCFGNSIPLRGELIRWNENIIHSVDLQIIIEKYPEYFEEIDNWNFQ